MIRFAGITEIFRLIFRQCIPTSIATHGHFQCCGADGFSPSIPLSMPSALAYMKPGSVPHYAVHGYHASSTRYAAHGSKLPGSW